MKVVITAGSLNGNSGAEAMLVTAIQRIKDQYPNAEFGIFTPYYKDDLEVWEPKVNIHLINSTPLVLALIIFPFSVLGAFFKLLRLNFLRYLFPKSVRFIWESSLLLDVAGVSFIDSRIKFLPFNVLTIYPGFLFRIPVVKLAQAVGPFNKSINRILSKHCFNRLHHLFARGSKTMEFLNELKLDNSKYSLSTDVVFCNNVGDSLTTENEDRLQSDIQKLRAGKKVNNKQIIGVCPSSVIARSENGGKYEEVIISIIENLLQTGKSVVLFPNATKEHKPEVWRNNDLPLINKIAKGFDNQDLKIFEYNLNADGVKELIKEVDFLVVSRFHAMIFSLLLDTPVVVLGWSHKYKEVLASYKLENYAANFGELSFNEVMALVNEGIKNQKEIKESLIENKKKIVDLSSQQFQLINKILRGNEK